MVAAPVISLVIPSYNRRESLLRVLDALREQSLGDGDFEVIVVLDGSTDGSAGALSALATPFALRVIEQGKAGAAAARNTGAALARGEFLLFVDDDVLLTPGAIAAHVAEQRRIGGGCVLGNLVNEPLHRGLPSHLCTGWPPERLKAGRVLWTDVFSGNLSIPRLVFERLGGFDTTLRRMEDVEFGFRCGLSGVRIGFSPEPEGRQVFSKTTRECLKDRRLDGAVTAVLRRRDPRVISMTTARRPARDGTMRPLVLLCLASLPIPSIFSNVLGGIPLWMPGAAGVFHGLNVHAYVRGVRSEIRSWSEWRAFFNRAGGWRPDDEAEACA